MDQKVERDKKVQIVGNWTKLEINQEQCVM